MPKTVDVLLVTFNCARELVEPEVLAAHIITTLNKEHILLPDILVLSLQEVAPIAYSYLGGSFLEPYLARFRRAVEVVEDSWIHETLDAEGISRGDNFEELIWHNIGMTAIMVFMLSDHRSSLDSIETAGVGVGWWGTGNKGCAGVRLRFKKKFHDSLDLVFLSAHLAPMEEARERRNEDWANIVRGLVFTPRDAEPPITRSRETNEERRALLHEEEDTEAKKLQGIYTSGSYVFIAGDLNYRTSERKPSPVDRASFPQPVEPEHVRHFSRLFEKDQLTAEMRKNRTLHGFLEFSVDFPPTYKYSDQARTSVLAAESAITSSLKRTHDLATVEPLIRYGEPYHWAWSNHRWPSWCDRILCLEGAGGESLDQLVTLRKYTALPLMSTSDHRSVILSIALPGKGLPVISSPHGPVFRPTAETWRDHPPFSIDPNWRGKRAWARRREIIIGLLTYLVLTCRGCGILFALLFSGLGIATAVQRSLSVKGNGIFP